MSSSENLFHQLTEESSQADQMKAIIEQLKKLDCLEEVKAAILSNKEEMECLGKAVSDLQDQHQRDRDEMLAEITTLKTQLKDQAHEISNQKKSLGALTSKLNASDKKVDVCAINVDDREQNSRNYCMRVNNIDVRSADGLPEIEHEQAVMLHLNEVFKPLLEPKKTELGLDVNNPNSYMETAHILPKPKTGDYKFAPVYVRFKKRSIRNFLLANKKDLEVRDCEKLKGVKSYSISADLTKKRFDYMQALIKSKTFSKVWHNDGYSVKFTLPHTGGKVYRIRMFEFTPQALIAKYSNANV